MDHSAKAYPILSRIRGLPKGYTMLTSLRKFDTNEVAQQRFKIIQFFETYGETATKEAFGADRKVIARWKKRLVDSGGKLQSLIPRSTSPKRVRSSTVDARIITFVKSQRELHPRIGKEKLKPDVDEFCNALGIPTISTSTIGREIKRNHFFYQKAGRMYHHPSEKRQSSVSNKKRLRIRHSPKPTEYGHILSDTVERITDGVRDYFISAIDAKMKFALTLRYKRLTAKNMKDFYDRFVQIYPGSIRVWQSDNGSENLGMFDRQLEKDCIPHLFIYPRCPKIDTFIERYNRTLQEEFLDYHLDTIHNHTLFAKELVEWNIYYNTKRRHHSLGLRSPLDYLVANNLMSQMSWTYTFTWKKALDEVEYEA